MAENSDVTNFTPTAKPEGTWVIFFLPSLVMYFPTRRSTGTPTRDPGFGREVAFCFGSALLGNFAISPRRARSVWRHDGGSAAYRGRAVRGVACRDGGRQRPWPWTRRNLIRGRDYSAVKPIRDIYRNNHTHAHMRLLIICNFMCIYFPTGFLTGPFFWPLAL